MRHNKKQQRMKMKTLVAILALLLCLPMITKAQTSYSGQFEAGYQHYLFRPIRVEPGPNWKGYNLDNRQNGFNLTSVNGITFKDRKLFTGIGLGYLNFEGINGVAIFGDITYLPLKKRVTPLLNFRLGYNHIWNQYEGGTGAVHTEFGVGINYKIKEKFGLYIKSGILITQQSFLLPITLGFRY
jgi:hypothetical protein